MIKLIGLIVAFMIGFTAGSGFADPYRVPSVVKPQQEKVYATRLRSSKMVDSWFNKKKAAPPKQRRVGRAN